jgi:hypothetical protein
MDLAETLGRSPELFPHSLDARTDAVSFIALTRAEYAAASFLDARILTPRTLITRIPWATVDAAIGAAELPARCDFIFHIGHVGSTLLSRLIGAHPQALCLREPVVLRGFAQIREEQYAGTAAWSDRDYSMRIDGCLKLLSRTYEEHQIAVVKATSFVSEIAADLLRRTRAPRALVAFVSPESYLATLFGGANSRHEAKLMMAARLRRLHRRLGRDAWQPASLSEGEALAMSWACEMSALSRIAGERVLAVNFDDFLIDPHAGLRRALRHFGIDASPPDIAAILRGPDMHRYSKAPEHAYDSALRLEVLAEARHRHGAEIRRGLAWLDRAAADFPAIRDGLALAATAAP